MIPLTLILLACLTLLGISPVQAVVASEIPKDMTRYLGDPDRGPEPTKQTGKLPPHTLIAAPNQGHPIRDYGHFRLKLAVFKAKGLRHPGPVDNKALISQFTVKDYQDGTLLKYSIMQAPTEQQQPKSGWPLVLLCPGAGGVGKQRIVSKRNDQYTSSSIWATKLYRQHFPAIVVQFHPQKRTVQYTEPNANDGMGIVKTLPALDAYEGLIDHLLKEHPVDRRRIYLLGYSMGGSSTWQLLARRPQFFAAAAPLAGSPVSDPTALKRIANGKTPIWMFMGNKDPWSGSSKYIWAYNKLSNLGHKQLRFWEIQDQGHSDAGQSMIPLAMWLWAQQRK